MQIRAFPVMLALGAISASAADPALDHQFEETVRPFVTKYCVGCHSGEKPAAQFDIKAFSSMEMVTQDYPRWAQVLARLSAKEMPPKPMPPPPADASRQVIDWIKAVRAEEIKRNAGDPGVVLARRLSNAEYNYTVRDLTGEDMQPTREFPIDPANPAGFDNSGESLTMSSALLKKYLEAARGVADHMVLTPDGIDFAPYPMLVETDRDKYAIQRIVNFYYRQPTDYADYFEAAWRFKNRAALGKPGATLASIAADSKISAKYLPMVWQILEDKNAPGADVGPVAKLQSMWHALPMPIGNPLGTNQMAVVRGRCIEMRDFVVRIRNHTAMQFAAPIVKGLPAGSQPLLNWKLREFASHRRNSDPKDLVNDIDAPPPVLEIPPYPDLHAEGAPRWFALSARARANDPDLVVPKAERSRYEASFARLASVFPDTFYVSERGRYFPDDSEDKGRLLSASYHNTMGYFRDDTPLMELILDEKGQKELDRLWDEFDFIAGYTARTWVQYFLNQSGEVEGKGDEAGSVRPLDHEITDTAVIMKLQEAYLAKALADPKNDPVAPKAIREHFDQVNATLRGLEKEHLESEPKQIDALLRFAAHAYRRPLTKAERDDVVAYYRTLRNKNGLSHEGAMRDSVAGLLMSPDFLYRIDLLDAGTPVRTMSVNTAAVAVQPLSAYALASRLSYFLWASMPDDELLQHATSGDLLKPEVLLAQTRRMLKDERVRGLATEFAGNWLQFRHFETINTVDRERFPRFTNDLREAMFQEPIRFIENLIHNDGSALDMLYGNYTFVNPVLARHYRMSKMAGDKDTWVRVDDADKYQRGGLLPMAVFLTLNSPGLRTSPVKRGNWTVQRVLGEVIPPPPPVVPELPTDEAKSDLPIREMLAKHRENAVCASCHGKFDSFGLAFESYGPVGDARRKDLAGRPVDTAVTYPGGSKGNGLEGLKTYIRDNRQQDFVNNLTRKLLAYALNRSLQLSDESIIEPMETEMAAKGYRIDWLIENIVTSPQFLNKRSPEPPQTRVASRR
jgi:Protein of unknown function (DUF1592)/Protein of unknown function (DUF1588)/Protein of unknown function (DUF1587)/Protein of unknown function (DUF1585)/Protein of unknown function (DUF1595)